MCVIILTQSKTKTQLEDKINDTSSYKDDLTVIKGSDEDTLKTEDVADGLETSLIIWIFKSSKLNLLLLTS